MFPRAVPVVQVAYEDLVRLVGRRIPQEELVARVPMMGGAYDGEKEGKLLFEFFPNRPDLLSLEGLARAVRAFFDIKTGLVQYPVEPTGQQVLVDPAVREVRPHIGFARVAGLHVDDAFLKELIDLQERLTTGPGRKRRKVAIGIHDAAPVRPPFTYTAVKRGEHPFVPLAMDKPLTPAQIFEKHDKGRIYGPLLEGHDRVPLILDADGKVLSLPPVINGQLTALSTRTRDVIVDVTGTDLAATMGILNIVVTSLAERGGKIQSYAIVDAQSKKALRTTPDLTPHARDLPYSRITELLGLKTTPEETRTFLGRMGHDFAPEGAKGGKVTSPAWRLDLLHVDDLVEDVGVGYGFDKFQPRLPLAPMFGGVHETTHRTRRARTVLLGLGFTEVVTLTITSRADAYERTGVTDGPAVEVENPVTLEHSILRPHLYTSLLGILRANKHRELPQSIFEVGFVVPPPGPQGPMPKELRAAGARVAARATFAEVKGYVEAALRDLGRKASFEPVKIPGFIEGRCAGIREDGKGIGFFGEVHPATLDAFELGAPAFAFELRL